MTHTSDQDTTALAAAEPVLSRAALFHQIRMNVYRLALTTSDGATSARRGIVTRPPLLTELRDAIRPDQGGTGGGGSAPNARVTLAVDAFDLYNVLTAQIGSAYESATERQPTDTPELMILEWFIELEATGRIRDGLSDAQLLAQRERVAGWVQRIENHFSPARRGEMPGASCLTCGATEAAVLIDGAEALAPSIHWARDATGLTVHCRACDTTWTGDDLELRDRFAWATRRNQRTHDLTAELTPDDWHHIRLDLRNRPHSTANLWRQASTKATVLGFRACLAEDPTPEGDSA